MRSTLLFTTKIPSAPFVPKNRNVKKRFSAERCLQHCVQGLRPAAAAEAGKTVACGAKINNDVSQCQRCIRT